MIAAALGADAPIEAVFVDTAADLAGASRSVVEAARERGIRVFGLAPGVMERIADAVTPQPVLAVVGYLDRPLQMITSGAVVVLVDVRDPGNVGAMIRTCDAAGIEAIVLCDGCGDLYNPKTVRASAGSLFHLPVVRGGQATSVLAELRERDFATVATVAHDGTDYAAAPLDPPIALVFGNEATGLPDDLVTSCSASLTIPVAGGAESLNVAMAAAVITFEIARRRRHGAAPALSMNL